jgi:hypothetical protein
MGHYFFLSLLIPCDPYEQRLIVGRGLATSVARVGFHCAYSTKFNGLPGRQLGVHMIEQGSRAGIGFNQGLLDRG